MNLLKILASATVLCTMASTPIQAGGGKEGDHEFKLENGVTPGKQRAPGQGRGGFGLQRPGGHLRLCPTGDCTQSIIDVSMERLFEVDSNGDLTKNRADSFKKLDFNWSAPITSLNEQGVNVTTSKFESLVPVDKANVNVTYKAQVDFYHTNGTAKNGEQVIDVAGGSLKFAVWIEDWPFLQDTNKLRLGLRINAKNKKGETKTKGEKIKGQGRDKLIDRLQLGDSMYIDSPVIAWIDDSKMGNISSYVLSEDGNVMIEYEFPKFKKLYYDPVVTSDEALDDTSGDGKNNNIRSDANDMKSMSSMMVLLGTAIVGYMML